MVKQGVESMNAGYWEKLTTHFSEVLEIPPEQRNHYIRQQFADQPDLLEDLFSLLEAHIQEGLLDNPLQADWSQILPDTEETGRKIGSFEIIKPLGQGGMGVVYHGKRVDGEFEQEVAIKVLPFGLMSKGMIRRFRTERQILASLQHSNISSLLDGGVTEDGTLWFAMEFIRGVHITDYCSKHHLSLDARLDLFLKVCRTVQFAHQNLIIHRDLKPSNILITEDGEPVLLDFGLGGFLQDPSDSGEDPLPVTRSVSKYWMTLEYASPEQVRGKALSTASDIYQLGIVLYELLTGKRPYDIKGCTSGEIETIICERQPVRPSTALATLSNVDAKQPDELLKHFGNKIKGDLDTIILKALHKDPGHRYNSAEAFADDLQRYQKGFPIYARPDTLSYRAKKFLRRNKLGTAAAAAFLILFISFSSLYSYRITAERTETQMEADKAQEVTDFLTQLFNANNPNYAPGQEIKATDLLRTGSERLEELDDQPELQAEMMTVIGNLYKDLGEFDESQDLLERALILREDLFGENHPYTIENMNELGTLYAAKSDFPKALELYSEAYRRDLDSKKIPDLSTANYLSNISSISSQMGRYDLAKEHILKSLEIHHALQQDSISTVYAIRLNNLAYILEKTGDYDGALKNYSRSLTIKEKVYNNEENTSIATTIHNIGRLLYETAQYDSALTYNKRALAIREKLYETDHPDIALSLMNIGVIYSTTARYEEAEKYYSKSLDIYTKTSGKDSYFSGMVLGNLGHLYLKKGGDLKTAQDYLEKGIRIYEKNLEPDHPVLLTRYERLSECHQLQHQYDEALAAYQKAMEIHQKRYPEDDNEYKDMEQNFRDLREEAALAVQMGS